MGTIRMAGSLLLGTALVAGCSEPNAPAALRNGRADVSAQTVVTIDFVVPDGTSIFTGPSGTQIIFVGESPTGTLQIGSCAPPLSIYTDFPVQTAILLPSGGAFVTASRLSPIIPASQTTAVPPGTRLGNIQPLGLCGNGPTIYNKYRGDIQ